MIVRLCVIVCGGALLRVSFKRQVTSNKSEVLSRFSTRIKHTFQALSVGC